MGHCYLRGSRGKSTNKAQKQYLERWGKNKRNKTQIQRMKNGEEWLAAVLNGVKVTTIETKKKFLA